jgi:hypothetical protein
MASKLFLVDLDLNLNKAKQFVFEDLSTDPSGTESRVYYNSTAKRLKVHNGTTYKTIAYTDDVPSVSITLTAPDLFTVTGSPAAYNGTLDFEWNNVAVNTVLSGPSSGSTSAIPTFRSLVAADIPEITSSKISNFTEASEDVIGNILTSSTHTGISVSYGDPGGTLSLTNTGVTGVIGTAHEIEISLNGIVPNPGTELTGQVTIGLPDNVTISGDLKVNGDLDIVGNINSFSTTTVNVEDNLFLLNSTVTGSPTVNAGIEVERGTSTNASLIWNETSDNWTAGLAGSEIAIARKYVTTTTGTTHTITHNLNTSDVTVSCYLSGSQVEADIVITDANTVTVTTNATATSLKTVVVG